VLTRSGLGAAVAAVSLAVCGIWWRYEEFVVIAVGVGILLGLALWSSRARLDADIHRRIDFPRVARGDPIRIHYRAVNEGRRTTPSATIIDWCDDEESRIELPPVPPHERVEVLGLIPTRRRGVFDVGPWEIERLDPFGLAVGHRISESFATIIVHPRIYDLMGPYGAMHTVEDEAVIRRSASDPMSGFVSLREYVQGDDPRLIHWPTTARMGTLMLREHVELRRPEFTVVLDTASTVASPEDFEEMVDIAASIAVHALESSVDVRLRTTARPYPGDLRVLDRDTQVLDLLTPVEQTSRDQTMVLAEVFRSGLDQAMIVTVTGPDGPSSTMRNAEKLSVIRVGEGATAGSGVSLAVEDAGEFARKWRPWW
jgi:uncharacterized protein (DUF58 family)